MNPLATRAHRDQRSTFGLDAARVRRGLWSRTFARALVLTSACIALGSAPDLSAGGPDKPAAAQAAKSQSHIPSAPQAPARVAEDIGAAKHEAAALAFARAHHPELASLLGALKANNPDGYRAALDDLFKASERLARIQERTPDRYARELEIWKIESRIRLVAARTVMGDNTSLRAELKQLLLERADLRIQQLQEDRDRLAARLGKLEAGIQSASASRDEDVEKELDKLLKNAKTRAAVVAKDQRTRRVPSKTMPTAIRGEGSAAPQPAPTPESRPN